ncbi:MAG: DUF6036 family nucleotidyltransferase [Myxococcota bacterium]
MASAPELILRTLDRHLRGPAQIRLMGGAALILAYGMDRTTEDADLLEDDRECELLIEQSGFSEALEAANAELAPRGLYVSHIWGPEQQILTPTWRTNCRPVPGLDFRHLRVTSLGPLDLIVSKLARADALDLEDVRHLIKHERLSSEAVRTAMDEAVVPKIYTEVFPASRARVEAMLEADAMHD